MNKCKKERKIMIELAILKKPLTGRKILIKMSKHLNSQRLFWKK